MLINAPDSVREKYRDLTNIRLIEALCNCRPGGNDPTARHILVSLKLLAQRHRFLWEQADALTVDIAAIVADLNPGLLAAHGVGPHTAAQLLITAGGNPERLCDEASFAALCGTAPVQASSGKSARHRLSRGGDRAANSALHTIAMVRMSCDPRTREYVRTQRDKGRSSAEILRLLKRAIVREVFRCLTQAIAVPAVGDLRPTRQSKNITLQAVATHFGVWPAHISEIERGVRRDDQLAQTYREWLLTA
jgi:transposase